MKEINQLISGRGLSPDITETEAKEVLKKIDLERTEPRILIKMIEQARDLGQNVMSNLEGLGNIIEDIIACLVREEILHTTKRKNKTVSALLEAPSAGVDGSYISASEIGGTYYFPISAVTVLFENARDIKPQVIFSRQTGIFQFSNWNDRAALLEAELKDLTLETDMFTEAIASNAQYILLDGPIVDPPNRYDMKVYKELVKQRKVLLEKVLKEEKIVVGVTKQVRSRYFVKMIRDLKDLKKYKRIIGRCRDRELLSYIFTKLLYKDPNVVPYISPTEPTYPAYEQDYKDDIKLLTTFTQARVDTSPVRLEYLPPEEKLTEIIAVLVANLTPSGKEFPIQIEIAHEKCHLRLGLGESVFEEISSHTPKDEISMIVESKLRGE